MKTYSIGRDLNCDIVINDSTDVISRRHALLNVTSFGKMTIIDQSSNGTYVNGIRISQNVPVPITRKDIISLAHVAKLDWNQVPKTNWWIMPVIAAIVLVVVLSIVFGGIKKSKSGDDINPGGRQIQTEQVDSALIKQKEKARLDSLKTVLRQDSIRKATEQIRRDSIENAKKKKIRKDTAKRKKEEEKAKEETEKKPKPRPLG